MWQAKHYNLPLTSPPPGFAMHCFVYASQRKPNTYLWLAQRDGFDVLPEPLVLMLGELNYALEVELTPLRRLPIEDAEQVLLNIGQQGWHLQLPPGDVMSASNWPNHHTRVDNSRD
jgi:uncharacterized protein